MRIVSLLPSLTELVFALGRGQDLVGVTHECDFPPEAERLPPLTASQIAADASSAAIDAEVAAQGGSLYTLDARRLEQLRPDLILTQAQCDVCAVNERTVRDVAATLPGGPRVESVNPTDLAGVHAMFRRVGTLLGEDEAAEGLIASFGRLAGEIARRRRGQERPGVALLEWVDPPYIAGHWNPELIELAGGREILGLAGAVSRRTTWAEVARAAPEVVLLSPCGFGLARTESELAALADVESWRALPAVRSGRLALVDGSAFFSRPGPRLDQSLAIAAAAIDPERCSDLAPERGWRPVRPVERIGPSIHDHGRDPNPPGT